eukprot:TRINITY_DN479_c0_g3_i1.p1 TRINITY_DN479_c0_g3~~TRINITY_DN479_c0_g3_i1.p1  ORF type:complete len:1004 (+),score=341.28 TRINITY_DN479_c0_g3_i1:67-3078(+)
MAAVPALTLPQPPGSLSSAPGPCPHRAEAVPALTLPLATQEDMHEGADGVPPQTSPTPQSRPEREPPAPVPAAATPPLSPCLTPDGKTRAVSRRTRSPRCSDASTSPCPLPPPLPTPQDGRGEARVRKHEPPPQLRGTPRRPALHNPGGGIAAALERRKGQARAATPRTGRGKGGRVTPTHTASKEPPLEKKCEDVLAAEALAVQRQLEAQNALLMTRVREAYARIDALEEKSHADHVRWAATLTDLRAQQPPSVPEAPHGDVAATMAALKRKVHELEVAAPRAAADEADCRAALEEKAVARARAEVAEELAEQREVHRQLDEVVDVLREELYAARAKAAHADAAAAQLRDSTAAVALLQEKHVKEAAVTAELHAQLAAHVRLLSQTSNVAEAAEARHINETTALQGTIAELAAEVSQLEGENAALREAGPAAGCYEQEECTVAAAEARRAAAEAAALEAEVRRLQDVEAAKNAQLQMLVEANGALRDDVDRLARGGAWESAEVGTHDAQALAAANAALAEEVATLREVHAIGQDAIKAAVEERSQYKAELCEVRAANAALTADLCRRPTTHDVQQLRDHISTLEHELALARRSHREHALASAKRDDTALRDTVARVQLSLMEAEKACGQGTAQPPPESFESADGMLVAASHGLRATLAVLSDRTCEANEVPARESSPVAEPRPSLVVDAARRRANLRGTARASPAVSPAPPARRCGDEESGHSTEPMHVHSRGASSEGAVQRVVREEATLTLTLESGADTTASASSSEAPSSESTLPPRSASHSPSECAAAAGDTASRCLDTEFDITTPDDAAVSDDFPDVLTPKDVLVAALVDPPACGLLGRAVVPPATLSRMGSCVSSVGGSSAAGVMTCDSVPTTGLPATRQGSSASTAGRVLHVDSIAVLSCRSNEEDWGAEAHLLLDPAAREQAEAHLRHMEERVEQLQSAIHQYDPPRGAAQPAAAVPPLAQLREKTAAQELQIRTLGAQLLQHSAAEQPSAPTPP